jgi:hypothetical protein
LPVNEKPLKTFVAVISLCVSKLPTSSSGLVQSTVSIGLSADDKDHFSIKFGKKQHWVIKADSFNLVF